MPSRGANPDRSRAPNHVRSREGKPRREKHASPANRGRHASRVRRGSRGIRESRESRAKHEIPVVTPAAAPDRALAGLAAVAVEGVVANSVRSATAAPTVARVLIGPSMGRVTGRHHRVGNPMNLGPEAMNFDWGDHRKARWTRLCAAILGDECHAHALTALLNLSEQHSTNESEISGGNLRAG